MGCGCCWAVTIEPFEVSRWRGGCGTVYGISMWSCRDRGCFFGKSEENERMATERGDEVQWRQEAAWVQFARCGSETGMGGRWV